MIFPVSTTPQAGPPTDGTNRKQLRAITALPYPRMTCLFQQTTYQYKNLSYKIISLYNLRVRYIYERLLTFSCAGYGTSVSFHDTSGEPTHSPFFTLIATVGVSRARIVELYRPSRGQFHRRSALLDIIDFLDQAERADRFGGDPLVRASEGELPADVPE